MFILFPSWNGIHVFPCKMASTIKLFKLEGRDSYDIYTRTRSLRTLKGYKELSLHGYIYGIIEGIKYLVDNKYHGFIIVTGNVGDGKSSLAEGICAYYSKMTGQPFTEENIVWRTENFIELTEREDNFGSVIWWDESIQGATSRSMGITAQGQELTNALVTKRFKKHLYILLIDDIMRYSHTIIKMAQAWIHVKSSGAKRGYFQAYTNRHKIKYIYDYMKYSKRMSFPKGVNPDGKGKFQDFSGLFIDSEKYNARKLEETSKMKEKKKTDKQIEKERMQKETMEDMIAKKKKIWHDAQPWLQKGYSKNATATKLGIPQSTFKQWYRQIEKEMDADVA